MQAGLVVGARGAVVKEIKAKTGVEDLMVGHRDDVKRIADVSARQCNALYASQCMLTTVYPFRRNLHFSSNTVAWIHRAADLPHPGSASRCSQGTCADEVCRAHICEAMSVMLLLMMWLASVGTTQRESQRSHGRI